MARIRTLLLSATALVAAGVACAGLDEGESDDTPSPTATPSNPDGCRIVWATVDTAERFNVFLVDAPYATWEAGFSEYDVAAPLGVYYGGVTGALEDAETAAITTSGEFELNLGSGLTVGASVAFLDSSAQQFFSVDLDTGAIGALVATGGTGTFSGVWSTEGGFAQGEGEISITVQGTDLTLGEYASYAECYTLDGAISEQDGGAPRVDLSRRRSRP